MQSKTGWKPIPIPLKVLTVVMILWVIGSFMNLPNLFNNGMPLFGRFVFGVNATILPILVDMIGPLVFLLALWTRKSWAVIWAFGYIGIFVLNNAVALFSVREQLGLPQILVPTVVSLVFLAVIYWQRSYFKAEPDL